MTRRYIALCFVTTCLFAEPHTTAESLVASKQKADMTYKEMMQIMGHSSKMILDGIINQNAQLVKEGANAINDHRAPNHKPWLIMAKEDQSAFKQMLIAYDQELHGGAENILDAVEKRDWFAVNSAFETLTQKCVTCHISWKERVVHASLYQAVIKFMKHNTYYNI